MAIYSLQRFILPSNNEIALPFTKCNRVLQNPVLTIDLL